MNTLIQALTLAEPEGYVRTFVDEGPPMNELLSQALEARQRGRLDPPVPPYYLRKLLAAIFSGRNACLAGGGISRTLERARAGSTHL